jgi:hypothetical protein
MVGCTCCYGNLIGYGDFCLFLVFRMMVVDGIYAGFSYIDLSDSL